MLAAIAGAGKTTLGPRPSAPRGCRRLQRQEGRAWGRSSTKPFSRAVGIVLKPEDHNILTPLTFLLQASGGGRSKYGHSARASMAKIRSPSPLLSQVTDGSAYMMRSSSVWERDLVALSLHTFLTEYPPPDVPPTGSAPAPPCRVSRSAHDSGRRPHPAPARTPPAQLLAHVKDATLPVGIRQHT